MNRTKLISILCLFFTIAIVSISVVAIYTLGIPNELNAIGDSIAGFASALAFIWLVGGFYMQQAELSLTREQHEGLRENADAQRKISQKEDCIQTIGLYVDSLEFSLELLHEKMLMLSKSNSKFSLPPFSKHLAPGVLRHKCKSIEQSNDPEMLEFINAYISVLNKDVSRYSNTFSTMLSYLDRMEDGEEVREIMISNSVYEDITNVIQSAENEGGLVGKIFSK